MGKSYRSLCGALFAATVLILFSSIINSVPSYAKDDKKNEKVILQLRWEDQFQFAGYYAANWLGYYSAEGLDVDIKSGFSDGQAISATEEVSNGNADFGVGGADILIADDKGYGLSIVASFFQRSPVEYYSLKKTKINTIFDLTKLNMARREADLLDVELQAILISEGISPSIKSYAPENRDFTVEDLTSRRYDVVPGYLGKIPYMAEKLGVKVKAIKPLDYGIDFYGDTLFTSKGLASSNPELVEKFRRATIKGWEYALENPDLISERIARSFQSSEAGRSYEELLDYNRSQADRVIELMHYPIVEVGNINPFRWQEMAETLKKLDIVDNGMDVKDIIFDYENIKLVRLNNQAKVGTLSVIVVVIISIIVVMIYLKGKNDTLNSEIEEREKAEAVLTHINQRYETIFNSAVIGITITDNFGRIIQVNDSWLMMVGISEEEALGSDIKDYLFEDSVASDEKLMEKVMSGEMKSYVVEKKYHRVKFREGDNDFFFGRIYMTRIYDIDLDEMVNLAMVVDITREKLELEENKSKEAIIIYQSRMAAIGEMIGNIAHQWRQPLNALSLVLANAKDSIDSEESDESDKEYVDGAFDKAHLLIQKMSSTIDDFRYFSNPKNDPVDFYVSDTIEKTLELFEDRMRLSEVEVNIHNNSRTTVHGHDNQFSQAIFNVIGNAVDAVRNNMGKRVIDITTEDISYLKSDYVKVSICDNGPGISSEHSDRIFDMYYTTKKHDGGTGLGLYMTRMIIANSFSGTIELDRSSERTCFRIVIPTARR